MSFAKRLVLGTILILILAVLILLWGAERSLRRDLEGDIAAASRAKPRLVREALPADSLGWDESVHRLAAAEPATASRWSTARAGCAPTAIFRLVRSPPSRITPAGPRFSAPCRAASGSRPGGAIRSGASSCTSPCPAGPGVIRVAADLAQVDEIITRAQRRRGRRALLAILVGHRARPRGGALDRAAADRYRARPPGRSPPAPRRGFPAPAFRTSTCWCRRCARCTGSWASASSELRREQAESAALVESMVEGVIAADERGRIVTANPAARRLLGYDPGEACRTWPSCSG